MQERYAAIEDADGNLVMTPYANISGYAGSALNGSRIRRCRKHTVTS